MLYEVITIVAGRGLARAIEASDRGLPSLGKTMQVNALTPAEKAKFREASQPVLISYIEGAYGPEGKAMLDAFLQAIKDASK